MPSKVNAQRFSAPAASEPSRRKRKSKKALRARFRRRLAIEALEGRGMLAADWQNPLMNYDVDDDGSVSPLDVLSIVNDLNSIGSRSLQLPFSGDAYLDVDGDSFVSPLDALVIINRLNAPPASRPMQLVLAKDTGASSTDRLTNDGRSLGEATLNAISIQTAKARVNRGDVFDVAIDSSGKFEIGTQAFVSLPDGNVKLTVYLADAGGADGLE